MYVYLCMYMYVYVYIYIQGCGCVGHTGAQGRPLVSDYQVHQGLTNAIRHLETLSALSH